MAISYPISLSAINTEVDSVNSGSLTTLSTNAIEGLSTLNESPYAMSEFNNYSHAFTSTYNNATQGGQAKGGGNVRNSATPNTSDWPVGSDGSDWEAYHFITNPGQGGIILQFRRSGNHTSGNTVALGWTSITSSGTNSWTINRSSMSYSAIFSNNITYVLFTITSGSYIAASGSGTYTLNV